MKSLLLIYFKNSKYSMFILDSHVYGNSINTAVLFQCGVSYALHFLGVTLWNLKILEDTVTASTANIAWNCYFTIQVVSYWLVAIYICIKMVSFGLMWSWKPNWGSLLPACLCNCSMDFTNHKGQNECDHPQQSIAHWFFSLYDSHKYWSSFFKQGGLLIYIS